MSGVNINRAEQIGTKNVELSIHKGPQFGNHNSVHCPKWKWQLLVFYALLTFHPKIIIIWVILNFHIVIKVLPQKWFWILKPNFQTAVDRFEKTWYEIYIEFEIAFLTSGMYSLSMSLKLSKGLGRVLTTPLNKLLRHLMLNLRRCGTDIKFWT